MRILIIGGTSFFGRALVAGALSRGHQVWTFNRGKTGPDDPAVHAIRGDRSRDDGVEPLRGMHFGAVIDPGGLVPAHVLRTAQALASTTPFYAYVSSVSAYCDWKAAPAGEEAPTYGGQPDEDGDPSDSTHYERRKAGCERAVWQTYDRHASLVLRPGTVIGPWDNVGWLLWWLRRAARGGDILAPGDPNRPLQLIDVRDIAAFILDRAEQLAGGTFNCVPDRPNATMADLLRSCISVTASTAKLIWVEEKFLLAQGAEPWFEIPLWFPDTPAHAFAWSVPGAAAAAAGLQCRTVDSSIGDTWSWLQAGGDVRLMPGVPPMGLEPIKERRILSEWRH